MTQSIEIDGKIIAPDVLLIKSLQGALELVEKRLDRVGEAGCGQVLIFYLDMSADASEVLDFCENIRSQYKAKDEEIAEKIVPYFVGIGSMTDQK